MRCDAMRFLGSLQAKTKFYTRASTALHSAHTIYQVITFCPQNGFGAVLQQCPVLLIGTRCVARSCPPNYRRFLH